jgi:hypothetical protein
VIAFLNLGDRDGLSSPPVISFPSYITGPNDQMTSDFADKIVHVRDLKTRMAIVWNHCKSKMVCEADEQRGEGDLDGDEPKKGHGGCGYLQLLNRK